MKNEMVRIKTSIHYTVGFGYLRSPSKTLLIHFVVTILRQLRSTNFMDCLTKACNSRIKLCMLIWMTSNLFP